VKNFPENPTLWLIGGAGIAFSLFGALLALLDRQAMAGVFGSFGVLLLLFAVFGDRITNAKAGPVSVDLAPPDAREPQGAPVRYIATVEESLREQRRNIAEDPPAPELLRDIDIDLPGVHSDEVQPADEADRAKHDEEE
jgi:hypothetical protein